MMITAIRTIEQAIEAAPSNTSGLVVEPWCPGEIYGIAADWAQAAGPVWFCGENGWESRHYQVGDFSHRPSEALECELQQALTASGNDESEAAALAADATEF